MNINITELEPTIFSYRVYDQDEDHDMYVATCQIHQYGDVGIVYAMHGQYLLKNLLKDLVEGSLKEKGIKRLEGYVLPIVNKFIHRICRPYPELKVTNTYTCISNEREFIWVSVERE